MAVMFKVDAHNTLSNPSDVILKSMVQNPAQVISDDHSDGLQVSDIVNYVKIERTIMVIKMSSNKFHK